MRIFCVVIMFEPLEFGAKNGKISKNLFFLGLLFSAAAVMNALIFFKKTRVMLGERDKKIPSRGVKQEM